MRIFSISQPENTYNQYHIDYVSEARFSEILLQHLLKERELYVYQYQPNLMLPPANSTEYAEDLLILLSDSTLKPYELDIIAQVYVQSSFEQGIIINKWEDLLPAVDEIVEHNQGFGLQGIYFYQSEPTEADDSYYADRIENYHASVKLLDNNQVAQWLYTWLRGEVSNRPSSYCIKYDGWDSKNPERWAIVLSDSYISPEKKHAEQERLDAKKQKDTTLPAPVDKPGKRHRLGWW